MPFPVDPPADTPVDPSALPVDFFDGRSARPRRGLARIEGGVFSLQGDELDLRLPIADVRWPERTRHGARLAHLRGGGSFQALDAAAWDAWARRGGLVESQVVRAQQSWRRTGVVVSLLILLAFVAWQWGVPLLAASVLRALPESVDRRIGDAALRSFDDGLLVPSQVPEARQNEIRRAFDHVVDRYPEDRGIKYRLVFRSSRPIGTSGRTQLGANAFALPGGAIVVTDEIVKLLAGRDDVLMGVLGHELGHVHHRHGMRMVVQATVVGGVLALAWGDVSSILGTAPAVLGQQAYSRDFERQADDESIAVLRSNDISPAVMVELFQRLAGSRPTVERGDASPRFNFEIAVASHPPDAERMARFRDAASR